MVSAHASRSERFSLEILRISLNTENTYWYEHQLASIETLQESFDASMQVVTLWYQSILLFERSTGTGTGIARQVREFCRIEFGSEFWGN